MLYSHRMLSHKDKGPLKTHLIPKASAVMALANLANSSAVGEDELVPTPRTNTCSESPSSISATRQYFTGEGGYNHVVFYISDTSATVCALSPSFGFSTSLHYVDVVFGN